MEHTLLVVGDNLKANPLMMQYLYRNYEKHFGTKGSVHFCSKNNNDLFLVLEEMMQRYDVLTIAASSESFSLIGKVLSTLSGDALELKTQTLVPSRAAAYEKDSYLLDLATGQVNVIKVVETCTLPPLLSHIQKGSVLFSLIGMDEDSCQILLSPLTQTYDVKMLTTPLIEGWLLIEAKSNKHGELASFLKGVKSLFPEKMIETNDAVEHIVQKLIANNKTITCAESCTGGLIASMLTQKAGVSAAINGTLVTYANPIKESWLGVDADILKQYGAVSEECVRGMLEGALGVAKASYAIATSGIAGPTGGTPEKPVGTVYIGVASDTGSFQVERLLLDGDREYIQQQSAFHALKLLLQLDSKMFF